MERSRTTPPRRHKSCSGEEVAEESREVALRNRKLRHPEHRNGRWQVGGHPGLEV